MSIIAKSYCAPRTEPKSRLTFSGNVTLRPSFLTSWRALLPENVGSSHPIHSKKEENETYLLYISRQHSGEPFEGAPGTLSTSPQGLHSITQLSSTTTSCVGQRLLGTHLKTGGTSKDQQDQIIGAISSKMKYEWQDK